MTTPKSARNRPISAPESSRSTTGSSGAFERRMNPSHELLPRSGRASCTAVRNENPSKIMAPTRMPTAHQSDSGSWGWRSLEMPS